MKNLQFLTVILACVLLSCCDPVTSDTDGPDPSQPDYIPSLPDTDPNSEECDISIPGVTMDNLPFIDCSTSTKPLRNMVMLNLLDIPCIWGFDVVSGSQYSIMWSLPEGVENGSEEHKALSEYLNTRMKKSSGSHEAYVNLIDGATDLIIDSRDISRNELEYCKEKGVEIETRPLALDAMAFIVHPSNSVRSLTIEQIRKIYTGEITNWKEVGGADLVIHPYMRDQDSGSQEKMETLIMKGQKMVDWPEMYLTTMLSPFYSVEEDSSGIAYSPYYFCSRMVRDLRKVRLLAIDGVYPEKESILAGNAGKKDGAYPFSSYIYVAIRSDEPKTSIAHQIFDLLLSDGNAKNLIDASGYIAIR